MIRDFTADLRDFSFYLHHGSYGVLYGYPADFGQFTSGFRDFTRVFTCFLDYDLRRISNRFTSDFSRKYKLYVYRSRVKINLTVIYWYGIP